MASYATFCLDGHLVYETDSGDDREICAHCTECGETTMSACQHCGEPIPNYIHGRNIRMSGEVPAHCPSCGEAYPWTARRVEEARRLVDRSVLDEPEKARVKDSLPALMVDGPSTEWAILETQSFMDSVDQQLRVAFARVMYPAATADVKKRLGLTQQLG